jgi:hypothetical protein
MNDRAVLGYRLGFIRLKLTNEVPREGHIDKLSVLCLGLLVAIFAHVLHPGPRKFADQ